MMVGGRNIASFIAKDNPPAALKFSDPILPGSDTLEEFPRSVASFPNAASRTSREIVVKPYRLIYGCVSPISS